MERLWTPYRDMGFHIFYLTLCTPYSHNSIGAAHMELDIRNQVQVTVQTTIRQLEMPTQEL